MEKSPVSHHLSASLARVLRVSGICVVVVALGFWLISGLTTSDSSAYSSNSSSYPPTDSFFLSSASSDINKIRVSYPGGVSHDLRRVENGWEILDGERWFAINPDRAASLFGSSGSGLEVFPGVTGSLQGTNPANHDRAFGVTPYSGILVAFYSDGNQVEEFYIGRAIRTNSGWGTYVRRPESNAVYQFPGKLTDNFSGESVHTWRRRFLFPGITPADIRQIQVSSSELTEGYTLARSEVSTTGWQVGIGPLVWEANPEIANALCEWIVRLRTADFLEEGTSQVDEGSIAQVSLLINGYASAVELRAHRDDEDSAIVRLQVDSPRDGESNMLGVFDLLPLWRDSSELLWFPSQAPEAFAGERVGANEPFALGAGEKF